MKIWLRRIFLLITIFSLAAEAFSDGEKKNIITIEQAQKTEYKKNKEKGDTIILTGGVIISVDNGTDKNTITADKVTYMRENDMIYAEGNVTLKSSGSSAGGEDVTADSLIFNTMTLEGVFDNGRIVQSQSDAMNLPSGSKLVVFSDNFGRDSSGTIAFKSGELTFCDDPNPHWKIRASRIWLLPGGEFAFLNAVVFVGRTPIMYLPAFYYPKDELIFNPAFGYDNRRGHFLNTTFYVFGRKPLDAKTPQSMKNSSSKDTDIDLYSFMKPNKLKEQVREGLVMHNTDKDYSGNTTNYLKLMGDYYTKLGGMVGISGVYNSGKIFSTLEGSLKLGFSNTLFRGNESNTYSPYAPHSGDIYHDSSEFLTMKLPFRYSGNIKASFSKPFNFSLSMPIHSDPYFQDDFDVRAESMDWISYLMDMGKEDTDTISISEISSFTWEMNSSYSPNLPDFFKPFISSFSISSLSSSMLFSSISRDEGKDGGWSQSEISDEVSRHTPDGRGSPQARFYYPSQITPIRVSARISGTIFQYPFPKKNKTKKSLNPSLNVPDSFLSEEELQKKQEEQEKLENEKQEEIADMAENNDEKKNQVEEVETFVFAENVLPDIAASSVSASQINGVKYNLTYSISPEYISQISYASNNPNYVNVPGSKASLKQPSDFSWEDIQSTYRQMKAPTTVTSSLNYRDNFLSLTDTFNFNPIYQDHPYLDDAYYSESSKNSVKTTDYSAIKLDLTNNNTLSLKPFAYTEHFADTGISYNTTFRMIRTKYVSTDPNEPEWEYLTTDFGDDESFTAHNLNFIFAAKEGNLTQNLTLSTTLPPQVDNYRVTLTLGSKYTSFSIASGFKKKSKNEDEWVKENLSQSFSLKLFNSKISLTESYVHNLEDDYQDSLRLSLSGYGLQFAYTASYVQGYKFEKKEGEKIGKYETKTEKEFQPYSLSIAYSLPSKTYKYLNEKVSFAPSLSTSVVYDFLRPTNSYFVFRPSVSFKINDILDISFSLESRNSVIYRYIKGMTGTDIPVGGETNIFLDLIDSFRFDDESRRRASGFKMKNFNMKISHDLHDWTLSAEFSIKPRLLTDSNNKSYYDFEPYMSFSVIWKPLEGIKTSIVDDYGEWKLNPSKTSDN